MRDIVRARGLSLPSQAVFKDHGLMTTCVFCDLIASDDVAWIASDQKAVAFRGLPVDELAPGHTLVIPRSHADALTSTSSEDLSATISLVQRVGRAMESARGATGTVVLQASGTDGGGSVPHLHFHVVPCWADDEATFWPDHHSSHALDGDPQALLVAELR